MFCTFAEIKTITIMKKKIMNELAEALQERDYLEYSKIPSLQKELKKYKLSKREKEDFEIYE